MRQLGERRPADAPPELSGRRLMKRRAPSGEEFLVQSLAQEHVGESPAGQLLQRLDDSHIGRPLEQRAHIELQHFGSERLDLQCSDDLHERVERELSTEDRRRPKYQPHVRRQERQTRAHDLADAFGLPSARPRKP